MYVSIFLNIIRQKQENKMSRAVRKQLLEVGESLKEASEVLSRLYHANEVDKMRTLLYDCQSCAIAMGNRIETVYGTEQKSIHLLEDYCETVYQLSENIEISEIWKKLTILLQDQIEDIQEKLEQELPDKLEIVFLPYKASMWDSLESIWKKADADPACDAYVVPIPYYDKNPDGSFAQIHYEIDQYPKTVPVVSYQNYDLKERHPDKIYIHNPYDEYNYVTSVHPFFYSKNLKQYTDRLIYVPYFVLTEIDPWNKAAIEGIAHFVTVSGVIHADKVIVQSENMRQVYINVMSKEFGENTRKYWEEKILGTGSPKFDKVTHTQVDDEDIPMEWRTYIYKPDGTKKKIILYNTSVSALLQYSEQYLAKIQRVFEIFKENLDHVVLLWRPHPLIQATISSMRPQLWVGYNKLVKEYRGAGWGIYDDTADLNRAIGMADAYYGDNSSLVQLCKKVGMPVMLQNISV